MKLDAITIKGRPPIRHFEAAGLSNVVVIAGPNGVGKTRLLEALLQTLRNPQADPTNARLIVSATSEDEQNEWGTSSLDSRDPAQAAILTRTLQRRQRRGNWKSSAFHFDSLRQFAQIQPLRWDWNFADPTAEEIGWDLLFNPFTQRFQDTIHAIYRMLGHHRAEIARRAIELQNSGHATMPLDFPDPLNRFREAFSLLLSPKTLADIDITNPQIRYQLDGQILGIETLSSGEKEAFNIVFDLLVRQPQDCIVLFDEPELHLHPELSFRLLKTLQVIGSRNQFVLFTHSSDIISSAMENSIIFVAPKPPGENQAVAVRSSDDTVTALRQLGQSLGVISLGRRIVLIEGAETSIDRDTYGAIVQDRYPGLVLAPSGSRSTILSFNQLLDDVLNKTVWGIEFFMLADRDNSLLPAYLGDLETRSQGRLRFLPRLHVENYFLDEHTIALSFADLVPAADWRRDPSIVRTRLLDIARHAIPVAVNQWISTQLRSLIGEVDVAAREVAEADLQDLLAKVNDTTSNEAHRIRSYLEPRVITQQITDPGQLIITTRISMEELTSLETWGPLVLSDCCGPLRSLPRPTVEDIDNVGEGCEPCPPGRCYIAGA